MLTELTFQDEVSGVILFGSVQTGRIGPGSDIDLLIVTDGHEYWREGKMVLGIPFDLFLIRYPSCWRDFTMKTR